MSPTIAVKRSCELWCACSRSAPDSREIWVVDNGSTDGTVLALRDEFPDVRVIALPSNEGVGARSHAFDLLRGKYVVLLDDDSYPIDDTVQRSVAILERDHGLGALGGRVLLPDGNEEASALPGVIISCGVCVRKEVIDRVGGFRAEFFRKAGEYDFSFRIWEAGYRVERFEDLVYHHDKVLSDRDRQLSHRMDLRNNLILAERFLPETVRFEYRRDWIHRYSAFARHDDCGDVVEQALRETHEWEDRERRLCRQLLSPSTMETVFQHGEQARTVHDWALRHGLRHVIVDNYSKNIFATYRACRESPLKMLAVLDEHPAFSGLEYRGLPIVSVETAKSLLSRHGDDGGVVLSNVNPAQMKARLDELRQRFEVPVLGLWVPRNTNARD